jgi:ParB-like nuclease domain
MPTVPAKARKKTATPAAKPTLEPAAGLSNPVDELQLEQLKIEWVPRSSVRPNKWNPNKMTDRDRALLRQSILEDGWTQPIVTLPDGTIVDGEQRWTTSGGSIQTHDIEAIIAKMQERAEQGYVTSPSILSRLERARSRVQQLEQEGVTSITLAHLTGGLVPVTRVDFTDDAHKMISTIRHNRARGAHQVDSMASITRDLQQMGLDFGDLEVRLGMFPDEIERLLDTDPLQDIDVTRPLSAAWEPVALTTMTNEQLTANDQAALVQARSQAVQTQAKQHALQVQEVEQQRAAETAQRVQQAETERGSALTQPEKQAIARQVAQALPTPEALKPAPLRKFIFFVSEDEYQLCAAVLGEPPIEGFLKLCRDVAARQHVTD